MSEPDRSRITEIYTAANHKRELMLTNKDLAQLGREQILKPGERISSETGIIYYSAEWLNDNDV